VFGSLHATPVNDHQYNSGFSVFSSPNKADIVVAKDGTGDFKTVQDAVDSVPNGNKLWVTIYISPGIYVEHVSVPASKPFIKLVGSVPEKTIISFNNTCKVNYHIDPIGYIESSTVSLYNSDFYAENITFENSYNGRMIQAIALATLATRQQFRNCIMRGYQDTLFACFGLQYFQNCTIYGAVDFIYGGANALFDHCKIHNIAGGAISAPNTDYELSYGLTFLNCTLTADPSVNNGSVFLGRTWGATGTADFLYCYEGSHINPVGWSNMGHPEYQPTVKVAEYANYGPGSAVGKRVAWSSQLTNAKAQNFTIASVLGGWIPF